MDYIKEAFSKVKSDISLLQIELNNLKTELKENRGLIIQICESVQEIFNKIDKINLLKEQLIKKENPTRQQIRSTHFDKTPADNLIFKSRNTENLRISTGNRGVPTDRQTDQQTDRQTEDSIENAAEMLKSLDYLKKEISKKFKNLTEQEWIVFAAIYQLDEERGYSDYSILAEKLKLSESSIRDYVARLIKKGISLNKTKINNKNVKLNISQSLKQIASLSAILALRDS